MRNQITPTPCTLQDAFDLMGCTAEDLDKPMAAWTLDFHIKSFMFIQPNGQFHVPSMGGYGDEYYDTFERAVEALNVIHYDLLEDGLHIPKFSGSWSSQMWEFLKDIHPDMVLSYFVWDICESWGCKDKPDAVKDLLRKVAAEDLNDEGMLEEAFEEVNQWASH